MKFLFCDKCNEGFSLGYESQSCRCGNAIGRYINSRVVEVSIKNPEKARVIGVVNSVIHGRVQKGEAFVIPYDNECVILKEERWI